MLTLSLAFSLALASGELEPIPIDDVPALIRTVNDVRSALRSLQAPLPATVEQELDSAIKIQNTDAIQEAIDKLVLLEATINPEGRVKIARGPRDARSTANQPDYFLVKVINQSGGQQRLTAHGRYIGAKDSPFSLTFVNAGPVTTDLIGTIVEYKVLKLSCREAGKRELTISIDAGQGTQDIGFRGEVPVLFEVTPSR